MQCVRNQTEFNLSNFSFTGNYRIILVLQLRVEFLAAIQLGLQEEDKQLLMYAPTLHSATDKMFPIHNGDSRIQPSPTCPRVSKTRSWEHTSTPSADRGGVIVPFLPSFSYFKMGQLSKIFFDRRLLSAEYKSRSVLQFIR